MERSNASLPRDDQSLCEKADESACTAERDSDVQGAGHPHRHPVRLDEDLAVAGGSGSGIREGPRNLEHCRQVHGGAGERRSVAEGLRTSTPLNWVPFVVNGAYTPSRWSVAARPLRMPMPFDADHGRPEGPGEAPPARPEGDQTAAAGTAP